MRRYYKGLILGRKWMRIGRGRPYIDGLIAFRRALGDEVGWLRWFSAHETDTEKRIVVEAFSRAMGLPIDPKEFWLDVARHFRLPPHRPLSREFIRGFSDGAIEEHYNSLPLTYGDEPLTRQ